MLKMIASVVSLLAAPAFAQSMNGMDMGQMKMDAPQKAGSRGQPAPAAKDAAPPTTSVPAPAPIGQIPDNTQAAAAGTSMSGMTGMSRGTMSGMAGMSGDTMLMHGSGTSELPAAGAMMHGVQANAAGWSLMLHGYAWGVYTDQGGPRGAKEAIVESMAMVEADHKIGSRSNLELRAMLSLEPLMGRRGYPLLFATGETANGVPLVDRQHPHDLFMELSARVDAGAFFLYGGPVAEPALGPSAFMHRPSAKFNADAPITHHWFDSTHITYGVVTAGAKHGSFQLEGSAFRGREPDERRYNIETPKLDSYAARLSWTPTPHWAAELSYGHLKSPEAQNPLQNEDRFIGSASYANKGVNATGGIAVKHILPGRTSTALFIEANDDFDKRESVFGRIESINNAELFADFPLDPHYDLPYRVTKFTLGYGYTVPIRGALAVTLGGSASVYAKPSALDAAYGKFPVSGSFFAKFALGG